MLPASGWTLANPSYNRPTVNRGFSTHSLLSSYSLNQGLTIFSL